MQNTEHTVRTRFLNNEINMVIPNSQSHGEWKTRKHENFINSFHFINNAIKKGLLPPFTYKKMS